jgi:hypothetical protein
MYDSHSSRSPVLLGCSGEEPGSRQSCALHVAQSTVSGVAEDNVPKAEVAARVKRARSWGAGVGQGVSECLGFQTANCQASSVCRVVYFELTIEKGKRAGCDDWGGVNGALLTKLRGIVVIGACV